MSKIVVEMSGDEAKLLASLQRVINAQSRVGDTAKKSLNNADRGFKMVIRAAKAFGVALVGSSGVAAAIRVISMEMDQLIQRQKRMKDAQLTLNQSRALLLKTVKTDDREKALAYSKQISADTGVPEEFIARNLATAYSASGGDLEASRASVQTAAQYSAERPEEIDSVSGALLDLSKVTKTLDMNVNLGYLKTVGALSRIVDLNLQATNIPRAVIGAQAFGATAEEAGAMFSSLSNAMADQTGEQSGTALISFTQQMRDFFRESGLANDFLMTKGRYRTSGEQLQYLQSNPEQALRFLEKASFERKAAGPIEQWLLDRNSVAATGYTKARGDFGDQAKLAREGAEALKAVLADPLEQVARTNRAVENAVNQLQTLNPLQAFGAIAREGNLNTLRELGMGAIAEQVEKLKYEFETGVGTTDAIETLRNNIEEQMQQLRHPTVRQIDKSVSDPFAYGTLAPPQYINVPRNPKVIELQKADVLEKLIEQLTVAVGYSRKIETELNRDVPKEMLEAARMNKEAAAELNEAASNMNNATRNAKANQWRKNN